MKNDKVLHIFCTLHGLFDILVHKKVLRSKILIALLCVILSPLSLTASDAVREDSVYRSRSKALDLFAFKTNIVEWLMTIPNFGVEVDLSASEFNKVSFGLTAKYNWNTYHKLAPTIVMNVLDVRPEFRYYYRSRKPEAGVKHHWYDVGKHLRNRKNPKSWRAQYIGLYGNYGNYGLMFTKEGWQGMCAGLGVSTGYALPMYEYKRGYVDIELGFSLGFQWATKDVFVHNPDNYTYSVVSQRKDFKFTPYPVVSELRVAFAWRSKSIKDKIKDDDERLRVKEYFDKVKGDYGPALSELTKTYYDEYITNTNSDRQARQIRNSDSLYVAGYLHLLETTAEQQLLNISTAFPDEMKSSDRADIRDMVKDKEEELIKQVQDIKKKTLTSFKKEWRVFRTERRKVMKAEKAAQRKVDAAQKEEQRKEKVQKKKTDKVSKDEQSGQEVKQKVDRKKKKEKTAKTELSERKVRQKADQEKKKEGQGKEKIEKKEVKTERRKVNSKQKQIEQRK